MALEQSIDRLSGLIEQLISQLEAGRTAKSGATAQPEVKAAKAEPAKAEAPSGLDYVKDVATRFSLLVAKDRTAAIALMREFKADAKKLEEAILGDDGKHDQGKMAAALAAINEKLGG